MGRHTKIAVMPEDIEKIERMVLPELDTPTNTKKGVEFMSPTDSFIRLAELHNKLKMNTISELDIPMYMAGNLVKVIEKLKNADKNIKIGDIKSNHGIISIEFECSDKKLEEDIKRKIFSYSRFMILKLSRRTEVYLNGLEIINHGSQE